MRPYVEATWGAWNEHEQLAKHALNYQPQTHRIITVDAEKVGLLAVEEHDDHLWLVKVYLFAAWRNQGIGRSLICQILDKARNWASRCACVSCASTTERADSTSRWVSGWFRRCPSGSSWRHSRVRSNLTLNRTCNSVRRPCLISFWTGRRPLPRAD